MRGIESTPHGGSSKQRQPPSAIVCWDKRDPFDLNYAGWLSRKIIEQSPIVIQYSMIGGRGTKHVNEYCFLLWALRCEKKKRKKSEIPSRTHFLCSICFWKKLLTLKTYAYSQINLYVNWLSDMAADVLPPEDQIWTDEKHFANEQNFFHPESRKFGNGL